MANYLKYFKRSIQVNYPEDYHRIISETTNHYNEIAADIRFISTTRQPMDKRLDISAYFLALIKVLEAKGEPFEAIKKTCIEIATEAVKPKNRIETLQKRLPVKLMTTGIGKMLITFLKIKFSNKPNPEGFVAEIITSNKETYGLGFGIDILECGICKFFKKHHYSSYVPILCEIDFMTTQIAGLKLVRTGTIANGAQKCDFRFRREN